MKIINLTKKSLISDHCKVARTFLDRALGLLNKANPRALIFQTRWGIHTFFLKQPIDIILLGTSSQVVNMAIDLSPNRFFLYPPRFKIVIELPQGSISSSKTSIGDKIFIE